MGLIIFICVTFFALQIILCILTIHHKTHSWKSKKCYYEFNIYKFLIIEGIYKIISCDSL